MKNNLSIKNILIIFSLLFLAMPVNCQMIEQDFKIEIIDKKIIDIKDSCDLSTPLSASATYCYAYAKGENSKIFRMASPRIQDYKPIVDKIKENNYSNSSTLNSTILRTVNYKDSVACIIRKERDDVIMHYMTCQNGSWLDDGEDLGSVDIEASIDKF